MKCDVCGTEMKPLFVGEFCPNDCDRKAPDPAETLFTDDEMERVLRSVLGSGDFDDTPTAEFCPVCCSSDTGPFVVPWDPAVTMHCNSCGKVW